MTNFTIWKIFDRQFNVVCYVQSSSCDMALKIARKYIDNSLSCMQMLDENEIMKGTIPYFEEKYLPTMEA